MFIILWHVSHGQSLFLVWKQNDGFRRRPTRRWEADKEGKGGEGEENGNNKKEQKQGKSNSKKPDAQKIGKNKIVSN